MGKTVIFPFTLENSSFCQAYLDQDDTCVLASLSGTGTIDQSIGKALNRLDDTGRIVDIHSIDLREVDKIILLESKNSELYEHIDELLVKWKDHQIEVISFSDKCREFMPMAVLQYRDFHVTDSYHYVFINKPIIFVGGIKETSEIAWLSYQIKKRFEKRKLKSIVISRYGCSIDQERYPYPDEFVSDRISAEYKVLLLNQYLQFLIRKHEPDVILIEVIGGPLRFDYHVFNYFGVYYYITSQAVSADLFLCTLPIGEYDDAYFTKLNDYIRHKFDLTIDGACLMNIKFEDSLSVTIENDDEYYYVSDSILQRYLEKNRQVRVVPFGACTDESYLDAVFVAILKKLEGAEDE